jgi:hypothetical protein
MHFVKWLRAHPGGSNTQFETIEDREADDSAARSLTGWNVTCRFKVKQKKSWKHSK